MISKIKWSGLDVEINDFFFFFFFRDNVARAGNKNTACAGSKSMHAHERKSTGYAVKVPTKIRNEQVDKIGMSNH